MTRTLSDAASAVSPAPAAARRDGLVPHGYETVTGTLIHLTPGVLGIAVVPSRRPARDPS